MTIKYLIITVLLSFKPKTFVKLNTSELSYYMLMNFNNFSHPKLS